MKKYLLKRNTSVKNILNTSILFLINIFLIFYLITEEHSSSTITLTLINSGEQGKIISDSFENYFRLGTIDGIYYTSESFNNLITASGQTITLELKTNFECCQGLFSFEGPKIIKEINMNYFTTSNITTTKNMFYNQTSLEKVTLGNFETGEVTNMESMFQDCISLTSVDIININFEKVQAMNYMFYNAQSITLLDFPSAKINNTIHLTSVFKNCKQLDTINLASFTIYKTF